MKAILPTVLAAGFAAMAAMAVAPVEVRVRQMPGGPRIFVDGKAVRPRFFYGSPTCLCNISSRRKAVLKIPFAADRDTTHGRIALDGYPGVDPIWYSDAKLVDLTVGTTNVVQLAMDETNTLHYVADGLTFRKGHRYHYVFTHRATRPRTYFTIEVSYFEDGHRTKLPYYYGDTLGNTVALAAKAGVHLFTAPGEANVCSAEDIVLVQALKEGPLEIDFNLCGDGNPHGPVRDTLTGAVVGNGPKVTIPFRLGETRLFCR